MDLTASAITKSSNTSFYYSFSLLPRQKREAIHAVYAFCRYTDDIVDEGTDQQSKILRLRRWRMELGRSLRGKSSYVILNQLGATARKFNIPVDHFYDLIRGMEMDLSKTRYETYEELYATAISSLPPSDSCAARFSGTGTLRRATTRSISALRSS